MIKGCFLSLALCFSAQLSAGINVLSITSQASEAILSNPMGNYFDWHLEGACFWLHKGWFPYISTTPFVKHYMPDLLISVYNKYGDNPFTEGLMIDKAEHVAGEQAARAYFGRSTGSGRTGSTRRGLLNRFYEVDVIGNPAIYPIQAVMALPHIQSVSTPYAPYYSSLSDVITWRSPEAEEALYPENLLPFVRNEGAKLMPWGNIFPRDGFITQGNGYKAAAVMAIRGGTIVTGEMAPHVAKSIKTGGCGWSHCTISPIKENDNQDVKFERLYPDGTTKFDTTDFGKNDITSLTPYGSNYMKDGGNNYVFMAWRKYEGCIYNSGKLIRVVRF